MVDLSPFAHGAGTWPLLAAGCCRWGSCCCQRRHQAEARQEGEVTSMPVPKALHTAPAAADEARLLGPSLWAGLGSAGGTGGCQAAAVTTVVP